MRPPKPLTDADREYMAALYERMEHALSMMPNNAVMRTAVREARKKMRLISDGTLPLSGRTKNWRDLLAYGTKHALYKERIDWLMLAGEYADYKAWGMDRLGR